MKPSRRFVLLATLKHWKLAAHTPSSPIEALGWFQILWFIGLIEGSGFFSGKYGLGLMKDATMSGTPGDYGVGFPTFLGKVSDATAKKSKLNAELANGRLAMMAVIGMFFQDGSSSGNGLRVQAVECV